MSNLPPGVSEGMIPGNRPEDLEEEAFWDRLDELLRVRARTMGFAMPDGVYDAEWYIQSVLIARDMGYERGVQDEKDERIMDEPREST